MPKNMEELYGPLGSYLGHFRQEKVLMAGHNTLSYAQAKKKPLGEGSRFAAIEAKAAASGARNPGAVAAAIGRKKYGAKKFAALSAAGRRGK